MVRARAAMAEALRVAHSVPQALAMAAADPPEYAVVDFKMPEPSGL